MSESEKHPKYLFGYDRDGNLRFNDKRAAIVRYSSVNPSERAAISPLEEQTLSP